MLKFDRANHSEVQSYAVSEVEGSTPHEPIALPIKDENDYRIYNDAIRDGILQAGNSLILYFQMLRPSSDGSIPESINEAIRERASRGKIQITVITAAEYDRLAGAFELKNIPNVEVFFSPELRSSDLSFTLIDGSCILFGVKKDNIKPSVYDPSDEWIRLESVQLGQILLAYVQLIQQTAILYETFAKEKIDDYTKRSYNSIPVAVEKLRLPKCEVERLLQ